MIEIAHTLVVNDGTTPELTAADVWSGLLAKATDPMTYVPSITACTVVEEFDGGLIRDIVHAGHPVREVVTWYPHEFVHFVRTHGAARGTIDNEIGHGDEGALTLTFRFRIAVDGIDPGSPQEDSFREAMESDYLDAVRTTLDAVRTRVSSGADAAAVVRPPSATEFARDVFRRVDAFDPPIFAELFAPEGRLVFANGDPMIGPEAIEAGVAGFFTTIKGLSHAITDEWHQQGDSVVQLEVTYHRLDDKQVSIPVVSIWHRRDDGLIDDYRVYFDLAPVFS